jgi:hypothetical protein
MILHQLLANDVELISFTPLTWPQGEPYLNATTRHQQSMVKSTSIPFEDGPQMSVSQRPYLQEGFDWRPAVR